MRTELARSWQSSDTWHTERTDEFDPEKIIGAVQRYLVSTCAGIDAGIVCRVVPQPHKPIGWGRAGGPSIHNRGRRGPPAGGGLIPGAGKGLARGWESDTWMAKVEKLVVSVIKKCSLFARFFLSATYMCWCIIE